MINTIAIRKENIEMTEKRSPLSPSQVGQLISDNNLKVIIEPWHRYFTDQQYIEKGAHVSNNLDAANIIFGVKEIPVDDLPRNKACVFFSHTIKGQSYNMPMLQQILDKNITLIDYEKVTDDAGRRLIFFGPFAGLAGAINAIWLLGKRLDYENIKNPFSIVKQAKNYSSLAEAKKAMREVADKIAAHGLPETGKPWVIAITGAGTVSKGAQEIIDLLPVKEVSPVDFKELQNKRAFDLKTLYKVVIDCDHFVKPRDPEKVFDWTDYFNNPENYQADFDRYLPDITVLINGIFWNTMYPRLITRDDIKKLYASENNPDLRVIADITCDIDGSIQFNMKTTTSDNPAYVYDPQTQQITDGVEGNGPVVMAVDKLPSEIPGEATEFFGNSLIGFVPALAKTDFSVPFDKLELPDEFKRAVITHQGDLTPDFKYLRDFLDARK